MTDSASDLIGSLNKDLKQKKGWVKSADTPVPSHEVDTQTLNFFSSKSEEDAFPFTQIRHMKHRKDAIHVYTYSAHIEIKGKRLGEMYSQLRRFKLSNVAVSREELAQQPFIETINVTYHDEEENHDKYTTS